MGHARLARERCSQEFGDFSDSRHLRRIDLLRLVKTHERVRLQQLVHELLPPDCLLYLVCPLLLHVGSGRNSAESRRLLLHEAHRCECVKWKRHERHERHARCELYEQCERL